MAQLMFIEMRTAFRKMVECLFFSFSQKKNQKKIVVARIARPSRLFAYRSASKARATTFRRLISCASKIEAN